jgi:sterol desaturase/sphingolipid hydroxylase (fatty acid hydroxylase superfamily)
MMDLSDWYTKDGVTRLYWLVTLTGFPILSMVVSISATYFATFFEPFSKDMTAAARVMNNPRSNRVLNWVANHTIAGVGTAVTFAYCLKNDRVWDANVLDLNITDCVKHFGVVCAWIAVMVVIYDFQTYWLHRAEHGFKWLYNWMHEMHHQNKFPNNAIDGIYGDMLEGFTIGCFAFWQICVFPAPFSASLSFLLFLAFFVQLNHSGHQVSIPWLAYNSRLHLLHHQKGVVNFAEHTPIWDWLFGTLCTDPVDLDKRVKQSQMRQKARQETAKAE